METNQEYVSEDSVETVHLKRGKGLFSHSLHPNRRDDGDRSWSIWVVRKCFYNSAPSEGNTLVDFSQHSGLSCLWENRKIAKLTQQLPGSPATVEYISHTFVIRRVFCQ